MWLLTAYQYAAPGLSLVISGVAAWYARDKSVRESQALPLKETLDSLWTIRRAYEPLNDTVEAGHGLIHTYTNVDHFPDIGEAPAALDEATRQLEVSKKQLKSPAEFRLDKVITSTKTLRESWQWAHQAVNNKPNNTAQSLGFVFDSVQRNLAECKGIVDRYIEILSEINRRRFLRRWYYGRHSKPAQKLLNLRVRAEGEE